MNQNLDVQAFQVRIPRKLHKVARLKSVRVEKSLNKVIEEKLGEWVNEPDESETKDSKQTKTA